MVNKLMQAAMVAAVAYGFAGLSAGAAVLMVDSVGSKSIQQQATSPCIISGVNCNNNGFPLIQYSNQGQLAMVDAWSPVYDADDLIALLGSNIYNVGLDVQDTNVAQTLTFFEIYVGNVSQANVAGATLTFNNNSTSEINGGGSQFAGSVLAFNTTGATSVPSVNPGAGFADYLIGPAALTPDTYVQFHAKLSGMNDGPDQFFLAGSVIPLPAALPLFLTAFASLGFIGWRRRAA